MYTKNLLEAGYIIGRRQSIFCRCSGQPLTQTLGAGLARVQLEGHPDGKSGFKHFQFTAGAPFRMQNKTRSEFLELSRAVWPQTRPPCLLARALSLAGIGHPLSPTRPAVSAPAGPRFGAKPAHTPAADGSATGLCQARRSWNRREWINEWSREDTKHCASIALVAVIYAPHTGPVQPHRAAEHTAARKRPPHAAQHAGGTAAPEVLRNSSWHYRATQEGWGQHTYWHCCLPLPTVSGRMPCLTEAAGTILLPWQQVYFLIRGRESKAGV